jgi:Co/Zn/Cd efflux system component
MSSCCQSDACSETDPRRGDPAFRRILWIVLAINAAMFIVEIVAGLAAGSASLQADALDFLGDTASYAISLFVVGMALRYRGMAALAKGATMGLFGVWVLGTVVWHSVMGTVPEPLTMGVIGSAALVSNAICFGLLYAYRSGDANMRSVWVCSRNDVLGNLAVLLAALGVFGTGTGWPDLIVATVMALLAIQGAIVVIRHGIDELNSARNGLPLSRSADLKGAVTRRVS